jgi:hypothetical protein
LEITWPILIVEVRYRTDGYPAVGYFFIMANWKRPDPELLPISRPRCPRCQLRMLAVGVSTGPEGFEHRLFECPKCKHAEEKILASDPLRSSAAGWLNSDLQPPK